MKNLSLLLVLTVSLCSFQKNDEQIFNTSLTITIRDDSGNLVEGASVKLFEKEVDYTTEKNVAEEGTSDAKGIVKFKKMKAISYFIIVRKGDADNSGGGERSGKLEEGKFNKITIIIQ